MMIHPVQQADTTRAGTATAYDSIWATTEVPTAEPVGLERIMLAEDKLFVVLAVVLIIWIGLIAFLYRNDRHLRRLERTLKADVDSGDSSHTPL